MDLQALLSKILQIPSNDVDIDKAEAYFNELNAKLEGSKIEDLLEEKDIVECYKLLLGRFHIEIKASNAIRVSTPNLLTSIGRAKEYFNPNSMEYMYV